MIARQAIPQPARSAARARTASKRRARRNQRRNAVGFARVAATVAVLAVPVMIYVMLMANLTSLNYALAKTTHVKTQLLEESLRLDDRIAKLQSRERLALLAARLKMRDPHVYAVVTIPAIQTPKPPPHGIAFLGSLAEWIKTP